MKKMLGGRLKPLMGSFRAKYFQATLKEEEKMKNDKRVGNILNKKTSRSIFTLLALLLCLLMFILPVHAQNQSLLANSAYEPSSDAQRQTVSILDRVVGLDISSYTIRLNGDRDSTHRSLAQEEIDLTLASSQGSTRISCAFIANTLHQIYISDVVGPMSLKQQAANELETSTTFLQRYQDFTANPFYGILSSMLDGIKSGKNVTATLGNISLSVLVIGEEETDFIWTYVDQNGIPAPSKNVLLEYSNGQLKGFLDNWQLYAISDVPKVTVADVKLTALNVVQDFSYSILTEENLTETISGFKVAAVSTPSICYLNYLDQDSARGGDPFTLYPSWYVQLGFDKVYPGGVTGAIVRLWADNGEVNMVAPMVVEGTSSEDNVAASCS